MIGEILCGRYEIVRRLGGGAMAEVFLATDAQDKDRRVAIKIINTEKYYKPNEVERFVREGALLCRLKHPNLVQGLDRGKHQDRPFIVMEYVDGPTVADLVKKRGHLSIEEARKLLLDVAMGLDHLFVRGAIQSHRDIKPTNILVTEGGVAKIADFGIAKAITEEEEMTLTTAFLGSPYYMSPEQIDDPRAADIRSDLYSLGAVFYETLTGDKAFPGRSKFEVLRAHSELDPPTFDSDLDDGVADYLLSKTLAVDPVDRFQCPRELIEYLAPKVGVDVEITNPRFSQSAIRLAWLASGLAVASAVAIGWAAVSWQPPAIGDVPASAISAEPTITMEQTATSEATPPVMDTYTPPEPRVNKPAAAPPKREPVGGRSGSGGGGVSVGSGASGVDANAASKSALGR